jgi:predicted nucleic acid-binding protein
MADYLADTNIPLYLVNPAAPEHSGSARGMERILANGDRVVLAAALAAASHGRFPVLPEPPEALDLWLDLVIRNSLRNKRSHDAHLLATMRANGVTELLTLSAADFQESQNAGEALDGTWVGH